MGVTDLEGFFSMNPARPTFDSQFGQMNCSNCVVGMGAESTDPSVRGKSPWERKGDGYGGAGDDIAETS